MAEIESSKSDPDSDYEPNATTAENGKQIIDADSTSIVSSAQIQPEYPEDSEA